MVLEMRVEEGLIDSVLEAVTDTVADAGREGGRMEGSFFHFYRKKRVVPGCNGVQARIRRAHASRARGFSSQPSPSIATLRFFLGLSNSLPQFDRLMLDLSLATGQQFSTSIRLFVRARHKIKTWELRSYNIFTRHNILFTFSFWIKVMCILYILFRKTFFKQKVVAIICTSN